MTDLETLEGILGNDYLNIMNRLKSALNHYDLKKIIQVLEEIEADIYNSALTDVRALTISPAFQKELDALKISKPNRLTHHINSQKKHQGITGKVRLFVTMNSHIMAVSTGVITALLFFLVFTHIH